MRTGALSRLGAVGAPGPGRPPRLVALDLDGTVLDGEQRLHPRVTASVRAAVAGGTHLVIATGRMYRSALPWASRLGITSPLICYQGAIVQTMPDVGAVERDGVPQGRVLAEDPVAGDAALAALDVAREHGWHVQAYRDDRLLCEEARPEAGVYSRIAGVAYELVDDLAPVMAGGSTKVVCVVTDEPGAAACEDALRGRLGASARVVRSLPQFVEVTNPVAGKGRALRRLCRVLGIGLEDVVAVGDAPNDADMLAVAGFAVAVEGAPAAVLAEADVLCAPAAEGGVADVLDGLGLTG